jgi:hypothetical protein
LIWQDFRGFVDLALALQFKSSKSGLAYLWRILDVEKKGYITGFDINYFYKV